MVAEDKLEWVSGPLGMQFMALGKSGLKGGSIYPQGNVWRWSANVGPIDIGSGQVEAEAEARRLTEKAFEAWVEEQS